MGSGVGSEGKGVGSIMVVEGAVVGIVDGGDPAAFFGGDVDECVEAEEGRTRGWRVADGGGRGWEGAVSGGVGKGVTGGVEDAEEGGGGVGMVEEGVDGAGSVGATGGVGRGRGAEKRGNVHATGRHDGKAQRVDSHN